MAKSASPMTWIDYSHKPILCNCLLYNNHQRCSRDGAGPRLLYTCRTQVPTRPSDGTVTRQGLVCLRRFPAIAARVGEGPFTHPFRPPYPRMAAAARSNSQCNFPVRYRKSRTNGRRPARPFRTAARSLGQKGACADERTSDRGDGGLAYNIGNFTRMLAMPNTVQPWSLTSVREKLIKVGAKVICHGRYVTFQLAEVAVSQQMSAEILSLIARLRPPPAPA